MLVNNDLQTKHSLFTA